MALVEYLIMKVVSWIDTILATVKANFFAGDGKFNQLFVLLLFGVLASRIFKFKINLGGGK